MKTTMAMMMIDDDVFWRRWRTT